MQTMLIALGYNCGSTGADGDFGKKTQSALKQFQKDRNLTVDGIYGPISKSTLESLYSSSNTRIMTESASTNDLQATSLKNLSNEELIKTIAPLFTEDEKNSGILACISLAQFILESGWGKSGLTQNANNGFGMKTNLSSNTWEGSTWDGTSIYKTQTKEQKPDGTIYTITAEFRKYPSLSTSIADHSAYLNGAKKGNSLRYAGLKNCLNYRTAAQIIKDGGYATSLSYVDSLCSLIEKWNLTQYNYNKSDPVLNTKFASSFDKSIAKTYTTTSRLNLRLGAGMDKQVLTVIPKGGKVQCYGFYTNDWYYVNYKDYIGFCKKDYLK